MKKVFISLIAILWHLSLNAQESEFEIHPNGLIYSEKTMSKLSTIVDSLNLKFKVCDANPRYYSLPKVRVSYLSFQASKDSVDAAILDLKKGMSSQKFKAKYPNANINDALSLSMRTYTNNENREILEFFKFPGGRYLWNEFFEIEKKDFDGKALGVWFTNDVKVWENKSQKKIEALMVLEKPKKELIAPEYAKMIQYGDCLIDTSASLFLTAASYGRYEKPQKEDSEETSIVNNFIDLFKKEPKEPDYYGYLSKYAKNNKVKELYSISDSIFMQSTEYKDYSIEKQKWEKEHNEFIQKVMSLPDFEVLKNNALKASSKNGYKARVLDYYMTLCGDEKASLQLKRSYRVVGGCSQDQAPRFHLQNIALLSANTANWESFLRAHLDVMNDRVERVSDGSYAWAGRKTYIKELEELGLDIPKLLIGTCLRFENSSKNHYFGNVTRIGRALSETKYEAEVEGELLKMIQDPQLDDFNRYICYYIFKNYTSFIKDKDKQGKVIEKLESAAKTLPDYIRNEVNKKD